MCFFIYICIVVGLTGVSGVNRAVVLLVITILSIAIIIRAVNYVMMLMISNKIAKEIFKVSLTWSGSTEAKSTWSNVERRYGNQSKNYYKGVFGVKLYRELDWSNVIACAYKGFDSYVVSVKNNVYTYRAIVSFSQIAKDGTKTQKSFVSTYTIDSDGKFTGFSYYEVFK